MQALRRPLAQRACARPGAAAGARVTLGAVRSGPSVPRAASPRSDAATEERSVVAHRADRAQRAAPEVHAGGAARGLLHSLGVSGKAGFGAAAALALALAVAGPAHALPGSFELPGIVGDDPVREGFVSGLLLILFAELGDKTFFLALLLALQADKRGVFLGTFGALAVMTVISVGLGVALHSFDDLLPQTGIPFDDVLAIALLVWFGVQTLSGAGDFTAKAGEEREEAEEALSDGSLASKESLALIASTFVLVFAAEWGDKSFLATIALAAASSPAGVIAGAVTGHGVATAIAVAGGSALSQVVSEKVVAYVGGSLFLVFAAATAFDLVTSLPAA
ncbi:unnamed protein product [Pedinophyceae sp. YPF-701]|nr:unnamed protein product [Pedinophyceae sp. YPF-701]